MAGPSWSNHPWPHHNGAALESSWLDAGWYNSESLGKRCPDELFLIFYSDQATQARQPGPNIPGRLCLGTGNTLAVPTPDLDPSAGSSQFMFLQPSIGLLSLLVEQGLVACSLTTTTNLEMCSQ